MKKGKITKEMLTDYIGRPSVLELKVEELLEHLRFQPVGAGNKRSFNTEALALERLKKELDRYFSIPEKMPADEQKKIRS